MEPITLQELVSYTKGRVITSHEAADPITITDVVIDSRQAKENSLFVALKGERVDGHNYIQKAFDLGAAVCLSQKDDIVPPEGKVILLVEDTVKALGDIGKGYKEKYGPFTVGVTGSIGKTSCKDTVFAALSGKFQTIKTQGNLNSIYGVPLTFFQIGPKTQAAVIEMGMDYAGEIDYMASLARPQIGIITNVGTAHIEHFGEEGQRGILKAKMEIASHVQPGGALILNGDDALLMEAARDLKSAAPATGHDPAAPKADAAPAKQAGAAPAFTILTYGYGDGCDAHILLSEHTQDANLHVVIETSGNCTKAKTGSAAATASANATASATCYDLTLPILGRHMALNIAAAILVGEMAGETKEEIENGLKAIQLTPHRLERIETPKYHIIDDAYNAGPASMIGSLETLSLLPGGKRKVAILGDIFELGAFSKEGHSQVGRYAKDLKDLAVLICVGPDAKWIASEAIDTAVSGGNASLGADVASPTVKAADENASRLDEVGVTATAVSGGNASLGADVASSAAKAVAENTSRLGEVGVTAAGAKVYHFPDLNALFKNLFTIVQEDDIILIKASHGMEFSRILEKLLET